MVTIYKIIFRTDGFNWNDGHICAAHWSTGERKNVHDLPDIPIPDDQFEKRKQKYITAKNVKNIYKNPTQKIQSQYKKSKRRFEIAQQVISNPPRPRTRSPMNKESSVVTPIRKHTPSRKQYQKRLEKANAKISESEKKLSETNLKNAQLEKQLKVLKQACLNDKKRIANLQNKLRDKNKKEFSHANLVFQLNLFQYLCCLNVDQFIYYIGLPYHTCT